MILRTTFTMRIHDNAIRTTARNMNITRQSQSRIRPRLIRLLRLISLENLGDSHLKIRRRTIRKRPRQKMTRQQQNIIYQLHNISSLPIIKLRSLTLLFKGAAIQIISSRTQPRQRRNHISISQMKIAKRIRNISTRIQMTPLRPLRHLTINNRAILSRRILARPRRIDNVPRKLGLDNRRIRINDALRPLVRKSILIMMIILRQHIHRPKPEYLTPRRLQIVIRMLTRRQPMHRMLRMTTTRHIHQKSSLVTSNRRSITEERLHRAKVNPRIQNPGLLIPLRKNKPISLSTMILGSLNVTIRLLINLLRHLDQAETPLTTRYKIRQRLFKHNELFKQGRTMINLASGRVLRQIPIIPQIGSL